MTKTVYIASAYTKGDQAENVKAQIDAADQLMNYGFAVYVPLLSHFQHMIHPRPYQDWIELDNIWVLKCDILLRLPGESAGADEEAQLARDNNMPVYHDIILLLDQECR